MDYENTPLLGSNALPVVPSIHVALKRVAVLDANQIRFHDVVNDESNLKDHPTEVSFALCVLLHLRKKKKQPPPSEDLYESWLAHKTGTGDADVLEDFIMEIWTLFLAEYRNVRDIETVLWTTFPLEDRNGRTSRVVDLLAETDSPTSLLSHPLVVAGFENAWRNGTGYLRPPTTYAILTRYDGLSTPR
ncbi:hypothetical protein DXG01_000070 [Tephrocybe rancida]|nr:hypothetical protein DXG01_000070 [Tephrocybe rancida]